MLRELLRLKANPLLEFGPPPSSSEGCGSTPLDIAAHNGHSDIVRELVEQLGIEGCDTKNGGEPALHVAASDQHVDIMANLTGAGVVDTMGLDILGAAGHIREVSAKFLLRQRHKESKGRVEDAYINARNTEGYTPLVFSIHGCFSQAPRIAQLLADAGADMTSAVQVMNSMGELILNGTPLAFTTSRLREKIANGQPATEEHLPAHAGGHPSLAVASRGSACGVSPMANRCSLHRPCSREFSWSRAEFSVAQGHVADPEATEKEARCA